MLTSEDAASISCTEVPAEPPAVFGSRPSDPAPPAAMARARLTLCSPGNFRKPVNKMETLKGADESRELGFLLGDWEPGGPERGEPHSPPAAGELPCVSGFLLRRRLGSVPTSSPQNRRFC